MTCGSVDPVKGMFRKQFGEPSGDEPVVIVGAAALVPAGRATPANETPTILEAA